MKMKSAYEADSAKTRAKRMAWWNDALDRAPNRASARGAMSQKGKTIYFWCGYWPGKEIGLGGFKTKLKSASLLVGGKSIDFEQNGPRIILKNLPTAVPDKFAGYTVIKLEFASKPVHNVRVTTPALVTGK